MEEKLIRRKEEIPCKHGHDLHYNCYNLKFKDKIKMLTQNDKHKIIKKFEEKF